MMRRLLLVTLSLWLLWAIRAHEILALPVFVDESLHIMRAQVVFRFSDAVSSFLPGKLLTYYYFALFQPKNYNALWLSRQAIALLAPLSASLCYAITKHFTRSFGASVGVIWLYALVPLMIFFERMALADTFALVFVLGLVWSSLLLAHRPTQRRAAITGSLLGLALLAKLTALPLVVVPPLTLWLFGKLDWRKLITVYAATGVLLALPAFYMVYQEAAQLENKQEVVSTTLFVPLERSRLEQIEFNLDTYRTALVRLLGGSVLILVAAAVPNRPRVSLFFLLIMGMSWSFIVLTSAFPSTRYLTISFPLILVWAVVNLAEARRVFRIVPRLPRYMRIPFGGFYVGMLALVVAGSISLVLYANTFINRAWLDPTQLNLGDQDEWEYFTHTSSGYALRDIAGLITYLEAPRQPVAILSFAGSCHSIRFYFSQDFNVRLRCPYFAFYDNPVLVKPEVWANEFAQAGHFYVIIESPNLLDYLPPQLSATSLGVFPRPHNGEPVYLYRVTFDARGQDD